jgi:hypothetical protein
METLKLSQSLSAGRRLATANRTILTIAAPLRVCVPDDTNTAARTVFA